MCIMMCVCDDAQLYVVLSAGDGTAVVAHLGACIQEIREWMIENMLKLNGKKLNSL